MYGSTVLLLTNLLVSSVLVKIYLILSQRVGHEVPGVVVWPLLLSEGWDGECSEILAT